MLVMDPKQVSEKITRQVDWVNALDSGVTISSGTITATRIDTEADVTSTFLVSGTLTVSGTKTIFTVQAGVASVHYRLTLTITLSNGNILKEDAEMAVEGT